MKIQSSNFNVVTWLISFCIAIVILLGSVVHNKQIDKFGLYIKENSITVKYFFQKNLFIYISNFVKAQYLVGVLTDKNASLRYQLAELNAIKLMNNLLILQNKKLTNLLNIRDNQAVNSFITTKISIKKIGINSLDLYIDLGESGGLKLNQLVISQQGIVGYIVKLYDHTADVIGVHDPDFKISVHAKRSNIDFIIQGNQYFKADILLYHKHSNFYENDVVYTSGLEGKFPRGIPVGTLIKENEQWKVELYEQFHSLDYVYVVE